MTGQSETAATHRVALITGSAVRLGAATARLLHGNDYNVVIHCHRSMDAAGSLCETLNSTRKNSARLLQADLGDMAQVAALSGNAAAAWGRLDVLVNNASTFYPTPLQTVSEQDWDALFAANAKAPLFLSRACSDALKQSGGCIVNMSDLYAGRGLTNHAIYTMAKGALEAMTRTLARELAPQIRVNAIAPGAILWPPDEGLSEEKKQQIIDKSFLQRMGSPDDIAQAILFLIEKGTYITGQIIHIDGGR